MNQQHHTADVPVPQATPAEFRWWCGNSLTILRLIGGVAYLLVPNSWRLPILAYCAMSDLIDGWLSRRLHATSLTGQILDPIADKVCIVAVLIRAMLEKDLLVWEFLILASRDISVTLAAMIALSLSQASWKKMPPRIPGKLATAGQFLFLINILSGYPRVPGLFTLAASCSIWAAIDYALVAVRAYTAHRIDQQPDQMASESLDA